MNMHPSENIPTDESLIGEKIESIVKMFTELYKDTGVEFFKAQASGLSQWVWMLSDAKRKTWCLTYKGEPCGAEYSTQKKKIQSTD